MSIIDPLAIGMKTPRIDNGCSLAKEFTKLISMNPYMILKPCDSCYDSVCSLLTSRHQRYLVDG